MGILELKNIYVEYYTGNVLGEKQIVHAVNGVNFTLEEGVTLGLVGETGAGKTTTALSIMRLLPDIQGRINSGEITLGDQNLLELSDKEMDSLRGRVLSMVFQDPMTFLNPILKIGTQLTEPLLNHTNMSKEEARKRAIELMTLVGIPSPEKRIDQYPFEFSGGMRQRIIIAIALANSPKLIIADEPTTALDVTIQAQVLELIDELKKTSNSAIIMITHDLGVVAKLCDKLAIMYGGKIVEMGTDRDIFYDPKHPYTKGLLACIANPDDDEEKELHPIAGSPPDLLNPPKGCPFVDRCEDALRVCKEYVPAVKQFSDTHSCACWLHDERVVTSK